MNKRYFRFALCLFCSFLLNLAAIAQQKITASLTVTNLTTNGMTFTVNGDTRTFTNNVVNPATMVLTNSDATGSGTKTNLLAQIQTTPFSQVRSVNRGSNSFDLVGNADLAMSLSFTAGYVSVSYSTQTVADVIALQGPISALPTAAARTNNASDIVGAASAPENTNSIAQGSKAASELVGTNNTQTISGQKTFSNSNSIWNGIISQLLGVANVLRGGYWANGFFYNPTSTNLVNYGSALSSPGPSGSGSQQFGGLASATNDAALAVGFLSQAYGENSMAVGYQASALSDGDIAIGVNAIAGGGGSIAFGDSANATNGSYAIGTGAVASNGGMAIGEDATSTFLHSVAIGTVSANTASNQVMLGAPGINTVVQNDLAVQTNLDVGGNASIHGLTTNQTWIGTNNFGANADIAFTRKAISSLANGGNAAVPIGTNMFVEVSGPGAAFSINGIANGRDGKLIVLLNQSGQVMTMANESGTDPVAANRIRTLTGADLATAANSICTLIYSGSASRWILLSAGTVSTVTNVSASQITGSIAANQIYSPITQTNFVLNQLYTNSSGGGISVHALASLTTAAVAGSSELDLMVAQNGSTFSMIDGPKLITSISAVTGAMQFGINGSVQTNGVYYFTNSSAGAGDSSSIVSGSGQVTGL